MVAQNDECPRSLRCVELMQQVAEEGLMVDGEERLGPSHAGGLPRRQDDGGHVRAHEG